MPVKGNRPTRQQVEPFVPQVIQRLEAGESLNSIVTSLELNRNITAELVHAQRPGLIQPPKKRHIDEALKQQVIEAYFQTGRIKAVANEYGVSPKSVQRWAYATEGVII